MRSNLSPQRRRIVVMSAGIACFGNLVLLMKGHPYLRIAALVAMTLALAYVIVELRKANRDEKLGCDGASDSR